LDLNKTLIRIEIDERECDHCGLCIDFCPVRVFTSERGMPRVVKLTACYVCRTCEDLCPRRAVRVIEI
jgi:NAD-dependent dihydropyrimidine dehydrogenase PreA subunit